MAADFARLIGTANGQRRIALGNFGKIFGDKRAYRIECTARLAVTTTDGVFHAPFRYYLVPFALSSRLWQGAMDAPSQLLSPRPTAIGRPPLELASALNRAYRRARRRSNVARADLRLDETHASLVEATKARVRPACRRRGEMLFPIGTMQVLLPAASDAPRLLRDLMAALRDARQTLPLTCRLYGAMAISLIHPFADGNGRVMRVVAATPGRESCETGALSRAIAMFLQGRQRLWNFTLPLALQGDGNAIWQHFERSVEVAVRLIVATDETAKRYQDEWGVRQRDLHSIADIWLVTSAVMTNRQFEYVMRRATPRIRTLAEHVYQPVSRDGGESCWVNAGAQQLVNRLTGSLITQL